MIVMRKMIQLNVKENMRRMTIKMYSNLMLVLTAVFLLSCDSISHVVSTRKTEDHKSLTFGYRYVVGGRLGSYTDLKINADTTYYYRQSRVLKSPIVEIDAYETTVETSDEQWYNLIEKFDLEVFMEIGSGRCGTCVDGVDEIFSVTVGGETYSFTNGYDDMYYRRMKDFFDLVKKIAAERQNPQH